jgi:hypothetical protein
MVQLQMEVVQELPQEVACGQRKAPRKVVVEDHRFTGLRSGDPLTADRAEAHEICGREHPTLAQ